jgi:hypothetical protein
VCFEQNIHQRSLEDITALARQWEAPPGTYTTATASLLLGEAGTGDTPTHREMCCLASITQDKQGVPALNSCQLLRCGFGFVWWKF